MTSTTPLHGDHNSTNWPASLRTGARRGRNPTNGFPTSSGINAVALAAVCRPPAWQTGAGALNGPQKTEWHPWRGDAAGSPLPLGFVEVPSTPPVPATVRDPDRAVPRRWHPTLHHTPMTTLPLDALVRAFVEGRSCCN